jgi:hypothetical protein
MTFTLPSYVVLSCSSVQESGISSIYPFKFIFSVPVLTSKSAYSSIIDHSLKATFSLDSRLLSSKISSARRNVVSRALILFSNNSTGLVTGFIELLRGFNDLFEGDEKLIESQV